MSIELTLVIIGNIGSGRGRKNSVVVGAVFGGHGNERCYMGKLRGGHGSEVGGDSATKREMERTSVRKKR
jgi:hypothetical protein